ncbi:MAG TPA: hypothetical protein VGV67_08075 [Solirubrobacteraceae bacterium]|nr:hypothetical protein [Solirubrobacteraceae bacterium]
MSATVVLRHARPEEDGVARRLAALDSASALRGDVVLALVGDRAVAALSLADDRVVADPFVRTASAVALLREFAAALRARPPAPACATRRRRFALRPAD